MDRANAQIPAIASRLTADIETPNQPTMAKRVPSNPAAEYLRCTPTGMVSCVMQKGTTFAK